MIIEWLLDVALSVVEWVIGLFGQDAPPDWLGQIAGLLGTLFAAVAGLGVWVPWALVITVFGGLMLLWLTGFLIKGVRWLLSWVPVLWGG